MGSGSGGSARLCGVSGLGQLWLAVRAAEGAGVESHPSQGLKTQNPCKTLSNPNFCTPCSHTA